MKFLVRSISRKQVKKLDAQGVKQEVEGVQMVLLSEDGFKMSLTGEDLPWQLESTRVGSELDFAEPKDFQKKLSVSAG